MAKSIEQAKEQLEEVIKAFEKLDKTVLPPTLKQAVRDEWSLKIEDLPMDVAAKYDGDLMKTDRSRVIPAPKVISIMQELEEEYVKAVVLSPQEVLWKNLSGVWGVLNNAKDILLDAVYAILFGQEIIGSLLAMCGSFLSYFILITSATKLGKAVSAAFRLRDKYCDKLRKAALPQRTGTRVRRRKMTRL